jgi:hypothetical protein
MLVDVAWVLGKMVVKHVMCILRKSPQLIVAILVFVAK